jgi:hypothetical protein
MVDLRIEVVAVFHIDEHSGISHKKWISTLQDCETTVIINISKHAGIGESLFFFPFPGFERPKEGFVQDGPRDVSPGWWD